MLRSRRDTSRQVSIRMGGFDGDPGIRPQFHTFVDSRAAWDEIHDDLPQWPEGWSREALAKQETREKS